MITMFLAFAFWVLACAFFVALAAGGNREE